MKGVCRWSVHGSLCWHNFFPSNNSAINAPYGATLVQSGTQVVSVKTLLQRAPLWLAAAAHNWTCMSGDARPLSNTRLLWAPRVLLRLMKQHDAGSRVSSTSWTEEVRYWSCSSRPMRLQDLRASAADNILTCCRVSECPSPPHRLKLKLCYHACHVAFAHAAEQRNTDHRPNYRK